MTRGDGAPAPHPYPASGSARATSSRRRRAILVVLALALATLVSGVPVWVRTAGTTALTGDVAVTVTGTQAAPGVAAAALVLLSAGIALGTAGRVGRWVVVGAVVAAGLLQSASALAVVTDPVPVARTVVAAATGVDTLAAPAALTVWPWAAVVVGVLVLLAGAWLGATSRLWARATGRHERAGTTAYGAVADDDQAAWDALTRGQDPT